MIKDQWWDAWSIHIHFPGIGWWYSLDEWDRENKSYGLDLTTQCVLSKDQTWWNFSLRLLGFGFSINRQFGY